MDIMDEKQCYEWGNLFNSDWDTLVKGMADRADKMDVHQEVISSTLIWRKDDAEQSRWIFVEDPSNIHAIRDVFNNDDNINSPACFVVVKQPDPSDDRGDIIFDIFRLNKLSYLWHFYRVYTPPKNR